MSDLHAVALQALHADQARVTQVSSNLANSATAGYRRVGTVARPVDVAQRFDAVVAQLQSGAESWRDARAGTLRATGQPLDLALEGAGWFEVATPAGPAYTRNGAFHVDAQGRLVDAAGHPVLGEGGEISVSRMPSVAPDGSVREDGRLVGRLRVVGFDDPAALVVGAGGLYTASSPGRARAAGESPIRSGHLENANVQPVREMVDLMQAMRRFESMHRAVQIHDDMLGTAIRKLGET